MFLGGGGAGGFEPTTNFQDHKTGLYISEVHSVLFFRYCKSPIVLNYNIHVHVFQKYLFDLLE